MEPSPTRGSNLWGEPPTMCSRTSLTPVAGDAFFLFRFTTSSTVSLDTLSFRAGQNDSPSGTSERDFQILLSAVDASLPAENGRTDSLTVPPYELLSTITVPYGFGLGAPPNFAEDLSGTTPAPGTYHIAFALTDSLNTSTTGLFIDDVTLTAVPEPTTALLLGGGLLGLAARRRRRKA